MTTQPLAPRTFDLSATPAVGFGHLTRVELRKMADTRAARWLLISTGLVTAAVLAIMLAVVVAKDVTVSFGDFLVATNTPMGIILPVLGVLAVTQEFGQRTALVTFTQVPSRMRVHGAKFTAAMVIAVAAAVAGMVLAVAAYLLYGALSGTALNLDAGVGDLGRYVLLQALGLASGFAFGALLLNSAAAIVVLFSVTFVVTSMFELGSQIIGGWFADLRPWIDMQNAQGPLSEGGVTATEWAHLAVAALPWLVLPLVLGLRRIQRVEIK